MPRRARGPFTLYLRDGLWWVQFRIDGRRHRKPTGESHRGRAESAALAIWQEAKARAGAPVGDGKQFVKQLTAKLVAEAEQLGRAMSYSRDLEIDLRLHVLPRWRTIGEITTAAWEAAKPALHGEGHKWRSIQRMTKHLRMLVRYAVRVGALVNEPVLHAPAKGLMRGEEAERRAMTPRERDRFLAHIKPRSVRAWRIYVVMFFQGFRRSTVARLQPRWIDWKRGEIHIPASATKNRRPYDGALHERALAALKAQLRESKDLGEPLFGKLDHSNIFWASIDRLGIDRHGLTPHHVARHSLATQLGRTESDLVLRSVLGWESPEMSARYTHSSVELTRKALRRVR